MSRDDWDIVITPRRRLLDIGIGSLWRYRDLVALLVKRDFVAFYKQTVLGPLWYLLQPLFMTLVFTVVFGRIARIPTDGLPAPLFYLSGIVLWLYLANCLTQTSQTFTGNVAILGKVYFPRLVIPISVVITNLITFAIHFAVLAALLGYLAWKGAPIAPNGWIIALPLLVLDVALLGLGIGILVSSLTTRYRDLVFVVGFGTQLWMYATPIVYPLSQVPADWQWLAALNPMTAVVETFRYALLGTGTVRGAYLLVSGSITLFVLALGIVMFNRIERTSMDTV